MITDATDYAFVDFANGDLPTNNFDGWIMPRRSGPQSPYPVGMLKAEDVAFLAECVRDKVGAYKGLIYPSYDFVPGGYKPYDTDPGKVTPTKSISSNQMRNIRNYVTTQIGRGLPDGGIGFLRAPLSDVANHQIPNSTTIQGFIDSAWPPIVAQFGGTWTATSQASDFAAGQPVLAAPVEAIFDDAKNLVRPVYTLWAGEPPVTSSHFYLTATEGSVPSGMAGFFGYRANASGTPWAVKGNFSPSEIIKFPKDFLSSAKVWLLYVARCRVDSRLGGSIPSSLEHRAGLLCLSDYMTITLSSTDFDWWLMPDRATMLYNKILNDCGWTEYTTSEVAYQEILPLYCTATIAEGTPNGRTQWWT